VEKRKQLEAEQAAQRSHTSAPSPLPLAPSHLHILTWPLTRTGQTQQRAWW
jgi:hypothetical protein